MILTLLKNHLKRNRASGFKINPKNIAGVSALVLLSAVLLGLLGFILFQLTETFYRLDLSDVYLTVVFFILIIVLTVYEIVNIIKQLYQNKDNDIYLKLPVKKETIFLSKVIFIYLQQLLVSVVFLGVTAGIFGLVSNVSIYYYLRLFIIALVLPLLPLALASVLSIPVSYLIRFFKKNRGVLTIGLIAILGMFFAAYIGFVQIVLKFINLTGNSDTPLIDDSVIIELKNMVSNLNISSMFYKMLNFTSFKVLFTNFGYILLIIGVLVVGSYFVLKYFYFKALSNQNEKTSYAAKVIKKENKPVISIFNKEFKILSRNPNYAFQAIVMNVLMPIFIFLTIKLTEQAGKLAVGEEIVPGVTLLTFLIFVLLANSFQGTIISREKQAYYISKIIPVAPFKQILARLSFGLVLSVLMITVSTLTILLANFITVKDGLFIYFMTLMFLFGYTFNSVAKDYKNPQLTSNEGGFDEGLNMYNTLLGGLMVAVSLGIIYIVVPYFEKLFPGQRVFQLFGFLIIRLTKERVNLILYGIILITIFGYALTGFLRLRREVKRT